MYLQNIDQICPVIFGIICRNIQKLELSIIILNMGVKVLKRGHTFRTRYNNRSNLN